MVTANNLSMLANMLPSTAEAQTVLSQAISSYLQPNSFKTEKYTFVHQFWRSTPACAAAATYGISSAKTSVVADRSGRVVVIVFAQEATASGAEQAATEVVTSEYQHLQKIGSAVSPALLITWDEQRRSLRPRRAARRRRRAPRASS